MDIIKFGEKIKELRAKKCFTQEKLAELAELSTSYVSEIERGKTGIGLAAFLRIANALGVSAEEILCEFENRYEKQQRINRYLNIYNEKLYELICNASPKEVDDTVRILCDLVYVIKNGCGDKENKIKIEGKN